MTKGTPADPARLSVIKGGKLSPDEFIQLPLEQKPAYLKKVGARTRIDLILTDPDAQRLTRAIPPQDLYWTLKEVGETDALEVVALASPEQFGFFLDMELWQQWNLSLEQARAWFGYLLECGDELLVEVILQLDPELLILFLKREIIVGGGTGDIVIDEERLAEWDHTFDNLYYITFRDRNSTELVSRLIDSLFRLAHPLYLGLMEGVKNEVEGELEELACRFRSGRLADLGFPEPEEALAIYAPILPEQFTRRGDKEAAQYQESAETPLPALFSEESLLHRVLALAASEGLHAELQHLINSALVVEGAPYGDTNAMESVFQRVHGWLNIALELQSGGDEAKALELVRGEYLKHLFQLGCGMVTSLKRRAERLAAARNDLNYATGKLLNGLKAPRPHFYRGLDPDQVDGYREFRTLADIRLIENFLRTIENNG